MTPQQITYYNQLIQHLSKQQSGYKFCLNSDFYKNNFPGNTLSVADRKAIGRNFSAQVNSGKGVVSGNGITVNVAFHYKFSQCKRCGHKDSSNRIHYIIT